MQPINQSYKEVLSEFKEQGYQSRSFDQFSATKKHLLLRHDVDLCLRRAHQIAKIEAAFGWRSTYFILMTSPFYNALDPVNVHLLRSISLLGHEIGLHLELEKDVDLQGKADFEAGILEGLIGKSVDLVSFHRPTANASDIKYSEISLSGFSHTYEKRFFKDIGYCSDSRGAWHYGHPREHESVKKGAAIQFLTHPIWWTSSLDQLKPETILYEFQKDHGDSILKEMKNNFNVNWIND